MNSQERLSRQYYSSELKFKRVKMALSSTDEDSCVVALPLNIILMITCSLNGLDSDTSSKSLRCNISSGYLDYELAKTIISKK